MRWGVRLFILGLAIFLLIGGPLPTYAARLIPSLSPFSIWAAALAHRAWYISLAWSLPALLVFLLALWKGRFFCRWICPLGTLYSVPSQFSLKKRFFPWKLNGLIFWLVVFASAAGLPLLLFLDPLSTFTRLGAMGQGAAHVMVWVPGLLIPLMLLLSFIQPHIWCMQLCPLGYLVEKVKVRKSVPRKVNRSRRELLGGLVLGVPLALLFRNIARAANKPVMPPGVKNLDNFSATCIRCYACVNACPSGVLTVRKAGGLAELCLPELDFDKHEGAYCRYDCNACSEVCPTGAIQDLPMDKKRQQKIANAYIIREACISWEDREECMDCAEACPYGAIEVRGRGRGVECPKINQEKCRGCGACRNVCPATRLGNAVQIEPLTEQKTILPKDDASSSEHGRRRRGRAD